MGRAWLWTALALVVIAAGSYALYVRLRPAPLPEQLLYGNGHVEGTEVRVPAEVSGRVVESTLVEGAPVKAGAPLVRLDSTDLELQREKARANVAAIGDEKRRLEQDLRSWRHHLDTAGSDLERYRELRKKGTVSAQRLEQAEDVYQDARGRVGALQAQIEGADARLEAARKALEIAENQLGKTRIASPIDGTILAKAVEPGEFAQPGQTVAVVVDLSELELKVFIPEKDIGKVALGNPARVRVDAFPDRFFAARVARVDQQAQFTPRDIHMPEERVRMVFGITLDVGNPDGILKPGMPADAWILWQSGATWPDRLFVPR